MDERRREPPRFRETMSPPTRGTRSILLDDRWRHTRWSRRPLRTCGPGSSGPSRWPTAGSGADACFGSTPADVGRPDAVHRRDPRLGRRLPSLFGGDRRKPRLNVGNAHVRLVSFGGGAILGERPLAADGIEPPATVDTYWGDGYAVARAERLHRRRPAADVGLPPGPSPLTDEMLRPAPTGRGVVQFDRRLTDDDFRALGEWFRAYPEMDLRAYGSYDHSITDLEFLRFFPTLRKFAADALWDSLTSLDGLRHLPPDLEELGIGATKASSTSPSCLASPSCDGSSSRVRRSTSR